MDKGKPTVVKPALYAWYYFELKEIAKKYGYNLLLHGSMNRDLDLVVIPWVEEIGDVNAMLGEFAEMVGGYVMKQTPEQINCHPHGRQSAIINIARTDRSGNDRAYYIDISIIQPMVKG